MSNVLIVGLGYVGLPIAIRAAEAGHHVIGVDVSQEKVDAVNDGHSYVEDVTEERLHAALASGAFSARHVSEPVTFDIALITVPTPVDDLKRPDLSYIVSASEWVAKNIQPGNTVILESTTYPGTTEDVVAHVIREHSGFEPGDDYHLGYSPERINPGDKVNTFQTVPKIVSGVNRDSLALIQGFYDTLVDRTVPVSSPRAAELAKVFENTFAQVNIALVNEMALVCSELGLDVDEVLDAAATKGHAIMRFRPGPGVGGHCIAVDPLYLTWMRRNQNGKAFRFAELADEINCGMPQHVVDRARCILAGNNLSLWEARVLVLGLAYKPGVADTRESPSLEVVRLLKEAGADVVTADPHVGTQSDADYAAKSAGSFDLVVVATDHSEFDYELIHQNALAILDTRNRYAAGTDRVFKL
jgi:UDP-N-acetyl-D-glucosamine dehydrogenase